MKKGWIAVLAAAAMLNALAAGYFFSTGSMRRGLVFAVVGLVLLGVMATKLRQKKKPDPFTAAQPPAINLAFYGELNRLIDEGKDISGYLSGCDAPKNIVKSVNPGGSTGWYYHRDGMAYNEFCAEFTGFEPPAHSHPYITSQRTEGNRHIITVDLYRALWDWGELHPEKRRYANSMRIAFHGAYKAPENDPDGSFLDKSIESVRSERAANKKNPNKKKSGKRSSSQKL